MKDDRMSDHVAIGEQFRRLAPEVQFTLAKQLGLTDKYQAVVHPNVWLIRAHFRGRLDELGQAIRETVITRLSASSAQSFQR